METYTVYKIICLKSNKIYIGFTKHTINHRLSTHFRNAKRTSSKNNKFGNAILKYGREHFLIESIFITNDKNIAIEKEKYFIKFYNAVKQGYNSSVGGEYGGNGINHADFNGENNPFFGKTHSLDSRKKISENVRGEKHPNFGKTGADTTFFGHTHSEITKQKMRDAQARLPSKKGIPIFKRISKIR